MLKELYIKNIAVIDELRLAFDKGFHIFTGETGAGKSILVESIGLVLGEKAKAPLIRDGFSEATVEAVFDIQDFSSVRELLAEEGLQNQDDKDELVVKRQISADGKNKVFINHQRSTLGLLQNIAALVIDYTGQHQQIELLDARRDIEVLDQFLPDPKLLQIYGASYDRARQTACEIDEITRLTLEKNERLEWIRYQLKELSELKIESTEDEAKLKSRREELKHSELVRSFSEKASKILTDGEDSCLNGLNQIIREAEKKSVLEGLFTDSLKELAEIKIRIEDAAFEIAKTASHGERGTISLTADEIESRLYQLEKLKRKFGPELADVLQKREELQGEKNRLENSDDHLLKLKQRLKTEFLGLAEVAGKISQGRHAVANQVKKAVLKELGELKMAGTTFEIAVESPSTLEDLSVFGPRGFDTVTFLLSPNPGLAMKPLAKIASGGETSRIFLALKQVLTRFRKSGTLIFDEIDTGISGAAVELTGKKLKTLADRFQVFCITHHAQIAGLADRHFLVSKDVLKGKTFTRVKILSSEERVQEVARLMGGVKISSKNLEYARELVLKYDPKIKIN